MNTGFVMEKKKEWTAERWRKWLLHLGPNFVEEEIREYLTAQKSDYPNRQENT